jgi:hypothetical protein
MSCEQTFGRAPKVRAIPLPLTPDARMLMHTKGFVVISFSMTQFVAGLACLLGLLVAFAAAQTPISYCSVRSLPSVLFI